MIRLFWKYAILLLLIAIMIFLKLHGLNEPLERDLTTYAYISHQILDGKELYTELWDHKPPGIYTVYILAELLWGYNQQTVVYLGIIFSVASLLFLYGFLNRITDRQTALLGSAFWIFASNSLMLQANQPNIETFINTFTIMALWALARWSGKRYLFLFLSGSCFALASWFKMIVIFPMGLICIYLLFPLPGKDMSRWFRERSSVLAFFLFPAGLLWIGTFTYFGILDRFADFWEAVFGYNQFYSGSMLKNAWFFFTSPGKLFNKCLAEIWILVLLSIAWFSLNQKQYGPFKRPFFVLLLFGLCLEVASPGYYYPHYYQLLLPILCILPALFFHDALKYANLSKNRYTKPLLLSIILFSLVLLGNHQAAFLKMTPFEISKKKYGDLFIKSYKVARLVEGLTSPSQKIYEWGAETGIYYYSKRNSVTGIIYIYPLIWGPKEERLKKIQKVFYDVSTSKPEVFIYNEQYGKIENNFFSQLLGQRYSLVKKIDPYLIFKKREERSF